MDGPLVIIDKSSSGRYFLAAIFAGIVDGANSHAHLCLQNYDKYRKSKFLHYSVLLYCVLKSVMYSQTSIIRGTWAY